MDGGLQLRDIHLPPEPSWWPPAPGWWVLALLLLVAFGWAGVALRRWLQRRRTRRQLLAQFDAVLALADPGARLAGIAGLLRRAALLHSPAAAALHGADWLRFLDGGSGSREFSSGRGRILLDGPFRRAVEASTVDALVAPARERFLELAGARR